MTKLTVFLVLGLISFNCSDSLTNYHEVLLYEEFSLRMGESAVISQQRIVIKFKSVEEDSRCPANAICVWEGNAKVVLELRNSNGDTLTSNLNTSIEPKEVNFTNLIIVLKSLTPNPILDSVINPSDYTATLMVKNKIGHDFPITTIRF